MERVCKRCKRDKKHELFRTWESAKCMVCEEEEEIIKGWRKMAPGRKEERIEKRKLKRKKRETREQKTCRRIHKNSIK